MAFKIFTFWFPEDRTTPEENLLRAAYDLDEAIGRLRAYEQAGADVLYAPGIRSLEDLRRVTSAVGKPVNVLAGFFPGASMADFEAAGARRVSLGGSLTWAAVRPLLDAGREMLERGTFDWLAQVAPGAEIRKLLD